jgi:predicted HTH domain antitoxin
MIKYKKIVEWMVIAEEQLKKLNLRNEEDFKEVFIKLFQAQIK